MAAPQTQRRKMKTRNYPHQISCKQVNLQH